MAFKYDSVVPWGRSFDEYRRMFALTDGELTSRLLGCGDGPAAFNASVHEQGGRAVSCDPLYQMTRDEIQSRIDATYSNVIEQTYRNRDHFLWTSIKSVEELGAMRMSAMKQFLADYDAGRRSGRYVAAELPHLPFESGAFDIALCSHFLFLYSDNLSFDLHEQAIREMCRVAGEARIFPLLTYNADTSPFLEPLMETLDSSGYDASVQVVPYEFQRGGDKMLRICRRSLTRSPS